MPNFPVCRMLTALALSFAATAQASHNTTAAGRASPLDAGADVPSATYESAFARYRPHADEKVRSWKDANDTVGRVGGWRSYAREAAQSESSPQAAPTMPASDGKVAPAPKGSDPHSKH